MTGCVLGAVMPGTKLQEHSGSEKAWVYTTVDFADEEQKPELFCIRFASPESERRCLPSTTCPFLPHMHRCHGMGLLCASVQKSSFPKRGIICPARLWHTLGVWHPKSPFPRNKEASCQNSAFIAGSEAEIVQLL